ncbi:NAD-dependent epimerase/dehydratase family protein [Paraburkholderia sp. GAS334]|uniref:NAD-dependent epimerase/dehydratase family protein n=1 Tax=Paraburkholderia sp. GAS334 TaxID=3035131 RepID=UPI003D221CEE
MRIFITGGAGCLGSNLIEHWIPAGHEILVLDNFATGKREVLPDVAGLRVVEGSVTDAELVDRLVAEFRPEVLVHSAASYKDPNDWENDAATNVQGSINVCRSAERHGVLRIINFQTALCYGRPESVPIPVSAPVAPFTSYGISKVAGEQFLMMSTLPVISLRLANITGPRLAIGPIPTFYKRLKAGQKCFCSDTVRDFLDMADFIALMDRLIVEDLPSGVYNVSTGEGHSIKEIFDLVADYVNVTLSEPVPVVPPGADDVPAVVLDPSETEKRIGWKAQYGFAETIRRQLAWYDAHGVTDIFSHLASPKA